MKPTEIRDIYNTVYSIEYMLNVDIGIIIEDASKFGIPTIKLEDGSTVIIDQGSIYFISPDGEEGINLISKIATSITKNLTKEQMESLAVRFKYLSNKLEPMNIAMAVSADLASNRIKDMIKYLY